jgi:hypothetical protein
MRVTMHDNLKNKTDHDLTRTSVGDGYHVCFNIHKSEERFVGSSFQTYNQTR